MRFISADYLYTLDLKPIKNGVLQLNNFGEITNIFKNKAEIPNQNIEFFNGILQIRVIKYAELVNSQYG